MFVLHAIKDKTLIKNPFGSIKIPSHKELLIDRRGKTEIGVLCKILKLHTELINGLTIHRLPLHMSLTKDFTAIGQIRAKQ
jgi:hypothetical protein